MNDVAELKRYVAVHARGQGLGDYEEILARVETEDAWVREWCRMGQEQERKGRDLHASRYYAMARFPYVDGPAREDALALCSRALGRWAASRTDVRPLELDLGDGRARCWTSGLSASDRKPLLLVMGGIVTVKEQWVPVLTTMRRLGMAGLVAEMPGVGENTSPYTAGSHQMLSRLLDAVRDRADVSRTYAVALSFSGHLALRCALGDRRIRGVITVGAPIGEFFTDTTWQSRLPRITVDTLAHLTATPPVTVLAGLGGWALTGEQLSALDIPVCYTASRRDEIIPAGEVELLKRHVRRLELVENDDVHGSPRYATATRLWTAASLLRVRDTRRPLRSAIELLMRAERLRSRAR